MVCEQVRTLLVASMLLTALGCGSGRGALDSANVWDDVDAQAAAQAATPVGPTSQSQSGAINIAGPVGVTNRTQLDQRAGAQYLGAQNMGAQYPGAQNMGPQSPGAQFHGAQFHGAQNMGAPHASGPRSNPPLNGQFASHQSGYAPGAIQRPQAANVYSPQSAPPVGAYATQYSATGGPPNSQHGNQQQTGIHPTANAAPFHGALPDGSVPAGSASRLEEFEPARIVAQVGDQYILAGDVLGAVEQMLEPHRSKFTDEQYAEQKERGVQLMVQRMLDNKLMYVAFLQQIPKDRLEEAMTGVREQAFQQYDERELEKAMKQAKVNSPAEYDAYLRKYGTSLYKQKLQYMELQLGRTSVMQNINANPEITHQEMLDYYHDHLADYAFEAKSRWEKLTARFDAHPDRSQGRYAIGVMGDQVRLGGAPLSAVAKRSSSGLDKNDGGYHDWTTRGSLKSKPIDHAIFTLPPGLLSDVIEDETGFHIVRVIERQEAGRTPFVEAQVEIRKTILDKKRQDQVDEFRKKLKRDITVWTVFDEEKTSAEAAAGANAPN